MVARIFIIASVACVFNLANGLSPPFPGFKPCKSSDNACILQNTNDGIKKFVGGLKDYGIESADPDHYERVDASKPNLKFILSNVTLTGLKNCKAVEAKRDEPNLQMVIVLQCDLKLDGDYEMAGKVLLVEMKGADKVHVELRNIIVKVICKYIYKEGKDGEKYIRIKNFEHSYEMKEKAILVFEGLFKDNEVLRTAVNQLIKDHSNEVIYDIGGEMIKAVTTKEVGDINKFFAKIPYKYLSLD